MAEATSCCRSKGAIFSNCPGAVELPGGSGLSEQSEEAQRVGERAPEKLRPVFNRALGGNNKLLCVSRIIRVTGWVVAGASLHLLSSPPPVPPPPLPLSPGCRDDFLSATACVCTYNRQVGMGSARSPAANPSGSILAPT